jgi:hypothetical protein
VTAQFDVQDRIKMDRMYISNTTEPNDIPVTYLMFGSYSND